MKGMAADTLTWIEQQEWLKPVEEGVQGALKKAFQEDDGAGKPVQSFLNGTWLGHPLHPVLTDIPVGAWSTALVLDLAGQKKAADAAVAIGLLGAAAAAVTGITDWKDTRQKDRRVGLVHGILNTVATALYGGSLLARKNGSRSTGKKLSYAGFAVVMASAWLGGEMVFKYRVGVDRSTEIKPPTDWTPVLPESELVENEPKQGNAAGLPVFLLKRRETIFAISNVCSHRGGPLSEGKLEGDCITCPWHGSTFNIKDGAVVNGPATHPQPRLELRVRDGQIEVKAAQQ